jgi:aminoglycoside N3'-acetyltransferase
VAEIEVQLKQRAVTGVLLTEGQKPTWIYDRLIEVNGKLLWMGVLFNDG